MQRAVWTMMRTEKLWSFEFIELWSRQASCPGGEASHYGVVDS